MKAILYGILAIALMGGLVGGGLFAHFNDIEESTGNTFVAGTVDIDIDDTVDNLNPDTIGDNYENPWEGPTITLVGVKPTQKFWKIIIVHNAGHNPIWVWKHIGLDADTPHIDIGDDDDRFRYPSASQFLASSEPEYEAEGGPDNHVADPCIENIIRYGCIIARQVNPDDPTGPPIFGDGVEDIDSRWGIEGGIDPNADDLVVVDPVADPPVYLSEWLCKWQGPWKLEKYCDYLIIIQLYHILQPADVNKYQGDGIKFNMEFYAEQGEGTPVGPP
jgi:predicted ribosomally synthesized peptide with SipW-like signal peptide